MSVHVKLSAVELSVHVKSEWSRTVSVHANTGALELSVHVNVSAVDLRQFMLM